MDSLHTNDLRLGPASRKAAAEAAAAAASPTSEQQREERVLSPAPSAAEGSMATEEGSLATDSCTSCNSPAEQELETDLQQQLPKCKIGAKSPCRYTQPRDHLRGPIQLLPGYPSLLPQGQVWGVPVHIPFHPAPCSHAQGSIWPEQAQARRDSGGRYRPSNVGQEGQQQQQQQGCVIKPEQGAPGCAGPKSVRWEPGSGCQAAQQWCCSSISSSSGGEGQEGQVQEGDGVDGANRLEVQGQKQEAGSEGCGQCSAEFEEGCSIASTDQQHCPQQWDGEHKQQQQQQQQLRPHNSCDGLQRLSCGVPAAAPPPLLPQSPQIHARRSVSSNNSSQGGAAPCVPPPHHHQHQEQQPRHHNRGKHRRGTRSHIPQQVLMGSSPPEPSLQLQLQQRRSQPFPLYPPLPPSPSSHPHLLHLSKPALSAPALQTLSPHQSMELPHPNPPFVPPRLSRVRFASSRVSAPTPPAAPTLNPATNTSSRVIAPSSLNTSLSTGNLTQYPVCRPPMPVSRCTAPPLHPQQQLLPVTHALPTAGGNYSSSTASMYAVRHPCSMQQAGSQSQHCHCHHSPHHQHERRHSSSSCISNASSISSWPSQSQSQSISVPSWTLHASGVTPASSTTPSSSSSSRGGGAEEDSSMSSLHVMEHPLSRAVCTPALPPNLVFPSSGSQMAPSNPSTRSRAAPTPVPVGLQRTGEGVACVAPY